ncbi:MAG: enoyl-CoA hydratase [Gammaproteobacteria bacterium]|nr:enoyl-CoA hydratase [Gammaproteobacteria bacterium]
MTQAAEGILREIDDGVGTIVLNQPDRHNAVTYDMWLGISAALEAFNDDGAVRVIVVRGAGERAFSAGADISEFEERRASEKDIETYDHAAYVAHEDLRTTPKPTIAMVRGYCIGGGMGLAMCCDLRIAAEDARFAIPAARLGIAYTLEDLRPLAELVGASFAKEILFTGRQFDAKEALQMGLANRVVPAAGLERFVADYARTIAGNAPLTIAAAKQTVAEVMKDPAERDLERIERLVRACYASEDYAEGRRAFMEKRKPVFRGR